MVNEDNIVRFPQKGADNADRNGRLIPSRLLEARLAKRLNQTELASKVGVSRQAISYYEAGEKLPEPTTIRALSEALEQPIAFFTQEAPPSFGSHSPNFFRKVGADTKRRNMACDVMARWVSQAAFAFDNIANYPAVDLLAFSPQNEDAAGYEDDEIETIAEKMREHFGLGLGPISNVVRLLEAKGVIVCRVQIEKENVEAFSYWSGSRPFIFLASEKESCARARFDAAHELGHLVLHRWIGAEEIEDKDRLKEIEKEADRFASAFLLPRKSFPHEVYSPRLAAFVDLKARWKVSIAAMIYRCKSLGIFDEYQVTNLYKQISFKKWRKVEPLDGPGGLPLEQPILLKRITELAIESGRLSKEEFLRSIPLSLGILEQIVGVAPGFMAVPAISIDFAPSLKPL